MALSMGVIDEYSEAVRVEVDTDHEVPWREGYTFVDETKPLEARVYCREMTLARGRKLYEIRLRSTGNTIGYSVPQEILDEAEAYRSGSALNSWADEPYDIRQVLQGAKEMVLEQFPRIPSYSAKLVAETFKHKRVTPRKSEIEEEVVAHARESYTSFEFRVHNLGKREAHVLKLTSKRMRDVLESWLPREVLIASSGRSVSDTISMKGRNRSRECH